MMKAYQSPLATLLTLAKEDILNVSGEMPKLNSILAEGDSSEIFGGFNAYPW